MSALITLGLAVGNILNTDALREMSRAATGSLAAALWQGVLLALAAGLGLRLLPRITAHARFAIWFAVFVAVAALPAISLLPGRAGVASAAHPLVVLDARWSLAILGLWAVASLVRAATLVVAALRVRSLWRRAEAVEPEATAQLPAAGQFPATARCAQLCVSDQVDRPSVIGFFAPKILIPRWLLGRLTPAELNQIVLHEGSHLRRADDWLNLVQKLALVLFPLNPALLWLERKLCIERELACDEQVLRATGAPRAYAACLASLAEHRMGRRSLALALGALGRKAEPQRGPRSELGRRVHNILSFGDRMSAARARLVTGLAAAVLLIAAGELSRCPQMVAFSDTPAATQAAGLTSATHFGVSEVGRYSARNVVFHQTSSAQIQGNAARLGRKSTGVNRFDISVMQPTENVPHEILLKASAGDGDAAFQQMGQQAGQQAVLQAAQEVPRPVQRWLVVTTSWVGADGSRLILTTATTSNSAPESSNPDAGGAQLQPDAAPQPVHPYAAVPVRGGWLVFQL